MVSGQNREPTDRHFDSSFLGNRRMKLDGDLKFVKPSVNMNREHNIFRLFEWSWPMARSVPQAVSTYTLSTNHPIIDVNGIVIASTRINIDLPEVSSSSSLPLDIVMHSETQINIKMSRF